VEEAQARRRRESTSKAAKEAALARIRLVEADQAEARVIERAQVESRSRTR
jgi:hypothetical protein